MQGPLGLHRLHFAFTITFHYIFPQLTMGLALLLVYLKTKALRTGDEHYNRAARFWAKIFGINFLLGVVTGIPMEFQFGTNWAEFSKTAGGVIGQTLAMEGIFSFFLESGFLGLLGTASEQMGALAIRAHHDGRDADRLLRDGRRRRVLPVDGTRRGVRAYVREDRCPRGRDSGLPPTVPNWRPAGKDGRQGATGDARGHGGVV